MTFHLPPPHLANFFSIVAEDYGTMPTGKGWITRPIPHGPNEAPRYIVLRRKDYDATQNKYFPKRLHMPGLVIKPPFFTSTRQHNPREVGEAEDTVAHRTLLYKSISARDGAREICHAMVASCMGAGPRVYDFWYDARHAKCPYYMVMEYLEGEDLSKYEDKTGETTPDRRFKLAFETLSQMTDFRHNDQFSRNVMRLPNGRLVPIDYGLSEALPRPGGNVDPLNYLGVTEPAKLQPSPLPGFHEMKRGNVGDLRDPNDPLYYGVRINDLDPARMPQRQLRMAEDPTYRKQAPPRRPKGEARAKWQKIPFFNDDDYENKTKMDDVMD